MAPAALHATILVTPNVNNRELEVGLIGDHYFSDSAQPLDGDKEPMAHLLEWRNLPPGHYEVIAEVTGLHGRHLVAKDSLDVMGDNE